MRGKRKSYQWCCLSTPAALALSTASLQMPPVSFSRGKTSAFLQLFLFSIFVPESSWSEADPGPWAPCHLDRLTSYQPAGADANHCSWKGSRKERPRFLTCGEGGVESGCFDWSTPVFALCVQHFNWSPAGFACQVVRIRGASRSSGPWHANPSSANPRPQTKSMVWVTGASTKEPQP